MINENYFFHFKKADQVYTNSKATVDIEKREDNQIMKELIEPYCEDNIKDRTDYLEIKEQVGNFHPSLGEMFPNKFENYLGELELITSEGTPMREILLSYLPDNDPTRENLTAFSKKFKELKTEIIKKIKMEKYEKVKAAIVIQRQFRELPKKNYIKQVDIFTKKHKKTENTKKNTKKHKKTKKQKKQKTKKEKNKNKKTQNTKKILKI